MYESNFKTLLPIIFFLWENTLLNRSLDNEVATDFLKVSLTYTTHDILIDI